MRTETMKVGGMTCGGCVSNVTKALNAVDGVKDVAVTLKPGAARIEFDENATSPAQLRAAVEQAGYEVDADDKSQTKAGCCS
ncbi:MAG: heavy-metal-associated domain-containing protein [Burkholderiaceae bacterium]